MWFCSVFNFFKVYQGTVMKKLGLAHGSNNAQNQNDMLRYKTKKYK